MIRSYGGARGPVSGRSLAATEAAKAYRDDPGDPAKEAALVAAVEGLVVKMAERCMASQPVRLAAIDIEDLAQRGRMLAPRAAVLYRPEKAAFSTYFTWVLWDQYRRMVKPEARRAARAVELGEWAGAPAAVPAGEAWDELQRDRLKAAVASLPGRWRQIVEWRYLEGEAVMPLTEIGRRLGVTRERARQLEAKAFRQIRIVLAARERKDSNRKEAV